MHINWKRIFKLLLLGVLVTVISHLYSSYPILGSTTFALFIAIIVSFLINPIVNWMEDKGIKRPLGIAITYLGIVAIFVFLGISIIPDLISQTTKFASNLPESINNLFNSLEKTLTSMNIDVEILGTARKNINDFLLGLTNYLPEMTGKIFEAVQSSLSAVVTIVLIPILTFFITKDKEKILNAGYNIIPKKYRDDAVYLYKEMNFSMTEFIRSRLLMAVFIGVATWIMLEIMGIPFALVIGILTMICDIIPYIGPFMATTPALIFAFINSPITFIWVGALSMILQWIEQNIVGAKLMSDSSGIHEIVILMSIIIGGGIFGVWGMILAIPAVITVNILIRYIIMKVKGIKPVFKERNVKNRKADR